MAMALLVLPGCKKSIDYLKDNPTAEFCPCRIRQFNYAGSSSLGTQHGGTDTIRFTYNSAGDPVSGIRVHASTGYPNWFFRYDRHGRLTDLIGRYNSTDTGGAERWNRYFYDGQGRIVSDSAYGFPGVVNDRPTIDPVYYTSVETAVFAYDHKGRVSKETIHNPSFTLVTTYAYDARGNRLEPVSDFTYNSLHSMAALSYDSKINYHRTSKVWMFIDKDYSVNNPIVADYIYNGFDLPVSIVPFTGTVQTFFSVAHTSYEFESATIEYDCQGGL